MADGKRRPAARPCPSCPYRLDAPPGLWAADEYDKLPLYDLDTAGQAEAGMFGVFCCHTDPGRLCAGWVATIDLDESLALRVNHARVDLDAVRAYRSPVPLHPSGQAAADHGRAGLAGPPSPATVAKGAQVARMIARRGRRGDVR